MSGAEACHAAAVPIEQAVTGTTVGVYAYSISDESDITVGRTTCAGCSEDRIEYPTLGGTEWLVRGTLALRSDVARQSHSLVFVADDGVVTVSPPTEGIDAALESVR